LSVPLSACCGTVHICNLLTSAPAAELYLALGHGPVANLHQGVSDAVVSA